MRRRVLAALNIVAIVAFNVPYFVVEPWTHAPPLMRFLVGAISAAVIVHEGTLLFTGRPPFDQAGQEVDDP